MKDKLTKEEKRMDWVYAFLIVIIVLLLGLFVDDRFFWIFTILDTLLGVFVAVIFIGWVLGIIEIDIKWKGKSSWR